MTDKKTRRLCAAADFAALLTVFLLPIGDTGRIAGAFILIPAAVLIPILVKKRSIHSINTRQVIIVITVVAVAIILIYYLSGIKFGFYRNPYGLATKNFFKFFLPISVIIVSTELIRAVFMAQGDKLTAVICYFASVISELLIVSNIPSVTSFNRFMDLVAGALFPALVANLLYGYLSKRYGMIPNIIFRSITTLYAYLFHIVPATEDSIVNFARLLIPMAVYLLISSVYEKKRKKALGNRSRLWRTISVILTICILVLMVGTVMLVSNQFKYGALVIATPSMTGELNKGDVVIFESYEQQPITEGQVIIFEKNGRTIVHRVVDIEIINGIARYYTKGDANEDWDAGFITIYEIRGIACKKLPVIGYPSLWMRSLFKR